MRDAPIIGKAPDGLRHQVIDAMPREAKDCLQAGQSPGVFVPAGAAISKAVRKAGDRSRAAANAGPPLREM